VDHGGGNVEKTRNLFEDLTWTFNLIVDTMIHTEFPRLPVEQKHQLFNQCEPEKTTVECHCAQTARSGTYHTRNAFGWDHQRYFNGSAAASFTVNSTGTAISATAPAGSTTGEILVKTAKRTLKSNFAFRVSPNTRNAAR
jgi:hypothetical protein